MKKKIKEAQGKSLDTTWLLGSLSTILVCILFRLNVDSPIQITTYVSIFFLASNLLLLPDFLKNHFTFNSKWYHSYAFILTSLLLFYTIIGWFCGYLDISFVSRFFVWISGLGLLFWHFKNHVRQINLFFLIGGITFISFLTLAIFATTESTPIYLKSIVTGLVHRDMMYHASLVENIAQWGIPSTGLHGTPFIHYHWGSHFIIAGLQGLIGIDALTFINIAYPAVFIPLFLKLWFRVFRKLSLFKEIKFYNPLFYLAFLSILYSIGFIKLTNVASISVNISLIFLFLLILLIFEYNDDHSHRVSRHLFFFTCTILLIIISISKISTGFLSVIGAGYLLLRLDKHKTKYLWTAGSGLLIAAIVYLFTLPVERFSDFQTNQSFFVFVYSSIFEWLTLNFSNTFGFLSYCLGLVIVTAYLLKKFRIKSFSDLKTLYLEKKLVDLEGIVLISFFAILVTPFLSTSADINFFILVPLNLSIIYAGIYLMVEYEKFNSKRVLLKIFLFSMILMSIISRPDISESHFYSEEIEKKYRQLTNDQEVLKKFIAEISALRDNHPDKKIAIYIPLSEQWYYDSQTYRPISASFIIPALSGIPMISGVAKFILDSERKTYGFAYYDQYTELPLSSVNQAIQTGKKMNFDKLIVYKAIQERLNKKVYDL